MSIGEKLYDFSIRKPKLYFFIVLILGIICGILGLIGVIILIFIGLIVMAVIGKSSLSIKRDLIKKIGLLKNKEIQTEFYDKLDKITGGYQIISLKKIQKDLNEIPQSEFIS